MKKILVFGITDNPGGMESVIMNYYRYMDRDKVQMEFLCNTQKVAYENEILQLGGVIYRIPARKDGIGAFRKALKKFFAENGNRYTAFWFNTCSLANIDYLKEAKKAGIPCRIIHCHNAANGDSFLRGMIHKLNQKKAIQLATDYWSCSSDANLWFYGKKDIEKRPEYRLINNAIAAKEFVLDENVRTQYRKQLNIENKIVLGHIGRFHFQKNQKFLIPIMKLLKEQNIDAVLLLVGQGDDQKMIKQKVEEEQLQDCVYFLGVRNDIKQLLWAMDVFVFPSVFEGLSLSILEAQAAGLPCVASDQISPKSKVEGNFQFLSLDAPPSKWVEVIVEVLKHERKDNCKCFVDAGLDIACEAKKMENFFVCGELTKIRR